MWIEERKKNAWLTSSGDFKENRTKMHAIAKVMFIWVFIAPLHLYLSLYHCTQRTVICAKMQLESREGRGSCLHGWSFIAYCKDYKKAV